MTGPVSWHLPREGDADKCDPEKIEPQELKITTMNQSGTACRARSEARAVLTSGCSPSPWERFMARA